MNAITSGQKFDKAQDINTVSKYFLSNDWLITEDKIILQWKNNNNNFTMEKLADTTFPQ